MTDLDDALNTPAGIRAKTEAVDIMLALSTTLAASADEERTLISVLTAMGQFAPTELLLASITREAKFVLMIAEGTGATADQVIRGDLATRHHDDVDLSMFDSMLATMRGDRPSAEGAAE